MMKWILSSMDKAPSFGAYRENIETITQMAYSNPTLSIELCKTTIEGICKTILTNKAAEISDNFPNLVSTTIKSLNVEMHPDAEHIKELSRRLGSVLHYIGEIRNRCNFASHGQDIEHQKPSSDLALFVIHTTNAILGFILHFYIVTGDYRKGERIKYDDFTEFNEEIDDEYNEFNYGYKISYSKALYDQDIEAYKELYNEYLNLQNEKLEETL